MLRIPGTLNNTTLGDVFGALHRGQVSGVLEVVEGNGCVHRVCWRSGCIVETAATVSLASGLEPLFRLRRAQLRFRVMRAPAQGVPLTPAEFLWGRPRARELRSAAPQAYPRRVDLQQLGLHETASLQQIRMRFRCLARKYHPDVHSLSSPDAQRVAARHFQRIAAAYSRLTA